MAKAQRIAYGTNLGNMNPFPSCCSTKTISSLGAMHTTGTSVDLLYPDTKAYIPPNIPDMSASSLEVLNILPRNLKTWPERIWHSFILQALLNKARLGRTPSGTGDNWRNHSFIIADQVANGRKYKRGSGFALWCRFVPGIKVIRSGEYTAAHGGMCETYVIRVDNIPEAQRYINRSLKMVNDRLTKLRESPMRKKKGSNITKKAYEELPRRYGVNVW